MNKFIEWLKASLEGNDGKSSAKMLTLLWAVVLVTALHVVFMIIAFRVVEKTAPTQASLDTMDRIRDLIALDWIILLILFGVATIASIIQIFKLFRGQTVADPVMVEEVTKTSKTVTEIKPQTNEESKSIPPADSSNTVG